MNCPRWSDDAHERDQAHETSAVSAATALAGAIQSRGLQPDDIAVAHGSLFRGVAPHAAYPGGLRGRTHPCLNKLVQAHGSLGAHPDAVARELAKVCEHVNAKVSELRRETDTKAQVVGAARMLGEVLGRLVKVQPFINGNGRTARLVCAALRIVLALPGPKQITPWPGARFDRAAQQAMKNDFSFFGVEILRELADE